jgi:hypothetical protein
MTQYDAMRMIRTRSTAIDMLHPTMTANVLSSDLFESSMTVGEEVVMFDIAQR